MSMALVSDTMTNIPPEPLAHRPLGSEEVKGILKAELKRRDRAGVRTPAGR
jgi:hypothetical protein